MSGLASHLFVAIFQQLLLIAAVVAGVYFWAKHRVSTRQRPIRVPVEQRSNRQGREARDVRVLVQHDDPDAPRNPLRIDTPRTDVSSRPRPRF